MIKASEALKKAKQNKWSRQGEAKNSSIYVPKTQFELKLTKESSVFAIGSCFARNIEEALGATGVSVLSADIEFPFETSSARKTGIMNKYNPGVIHQAISAAFEDMPAGADHSRLLRIGDDEYIDPLFKPGEKPQSLATAIDAIKAETDYFKKIKSCDTVFITLGMIEAWFDQKLDIYLNQPPHPKAIRAEPDRYFFKVMTTEEVVSHISSAINILLINDIKNIVITTSPVALGRTFTNRDVIEANCLSKSVLRVACHIITQEFENVYYYPSYESIIYGNREIAFQDDLIHASDYAVGIVIREFVSRFVENMEQGDDIIDNISTSKTSELQKMRKQIDKYKNLLIKHGISI